MLLASMKYRALYPESDALHRFTSAETC